MKVSKLLIELNKLPDDAEVFAEDSEYNGATRTINKVDYNKVAGWGQAPNTVILRR